MDNEKLNFTKPRFYILFVLILAGIALSLYLGYIFYKTNFHDVYLPSFCSVSSFIDCDGVSRTTYALTLGVPNALWGLLLYSVMMMLLFVDRIQERFKNTIFDVFENPRSYIAILSLLAFILSMVLAFISIKIINKICVLCFATYVVDLFIALCASSFYDDLVITVKDFIKGAKKYFLLFILVVVLGSGLLYFFDTTTIFSPKIKKEKAQREFFEAKKNKYAIKGNVLGKVTAPVTIKVYSDYNCPFCRVANIMLHKLAREQNVYIEEVQFPLDKSCNNRIGGTLGGHETSCHYSRYALAAQKQGRFWGVSSVLFDKHPKNSVELIEELKREHIDLDYQKMQSDANSPEIKERLKNEINMAANRGITGTPALEINGVLHMGVPSYDDLVELVKKEKQQKEEKEENKK